MRNYHQIFLAHRKTFLIFTLAFLLPAILIVFLGFNTFSKRREAVEKLLDSNIRISAETVLQDLQAVLLEHEQELLNQENFRQIEHTNESSQPGGQLFLLDSTYQIIFPKVGNENQIKDWQTEVLDETFSQTLQQAEKLEFTESNYVRAIQIYEESLRKTSSQLQKAELLKRLGRCLFKNGEYDKAEKVFNDLTNYSNLFDNVGHPYGLTAGLQLYEVAKIRNEEKQLEILIDLYEKLANGIWQINLSTYDFFISFIDSEILENSNDGKFSNYINRYLELKNKQSPYREKLLFCDLLQNEIVTRLKSQQNLFQTLNEIPQRFLIEPDKIISYLKFVNSKTKGFFIAGLCWNHQFLTNQVIQEVIEKTSESSAQQLILVNDQNENVLTGEKITGISKPIDLKYSLNLPWQLVVTNPEINYFERAAKRENLIYTILLILVISLMILGVVLIVRDISREAETSRLKTEFVHNISHELKTPLTLIRLYGETLQRKENLPDQDKKESYQIITKESERLSHMIDNVLDFSRIETGRKEFIFKKESLAKVVQEILESYQYHFDKKEFIVQSDIDKDLPEMNFDHESIANVVINLISNDQYFFFHLIISRFLF